MSSKHHIYILRCADGTLYTGYAADVERRVKEHNGELGKTAAKYTRGRRPVTCVYTEAFSTRSEALKREVALKKLTRPQKELLLLTNTQGTPDKRKKSAL